MAVWGRVRCGTYLISFDLTVAESPARFGGIPAVPDFGSGPFGAREGFVGTAAGTSFWTAARATLQNVLQLQLQLQLLQHQQQQQRQQQAAAAAAAAAT